MPLDLIQLSREMVAIPTHQGETELQRYLTAKLRALGLDVRLEEPIPDRFNVIAERGSGGPLLCSHADAFPPYDHPEPFALKQEGDILIGRAINDTKGQLAALLVALESSTGPCEIIVTADEEREGRGSLALAPRSKAAIVLEPTDMKICPAQAGFFEFELFVEGVPAHGTTPSAGRNAILDTFKFYEAAVAAPLFKSSHPLLGETWTTLGTIHGGYEVGAVPSKCTSTFVFGIWPEVALEAAEAEIRRLAELFHGSIRVIDKSLGYELAEDHPLTARVAAAFLAIGVEPGLGGMSSWTDAQNLIAKGIPSVVLGAGHIGSAHGNRESVRVSDLEALSRILATVIDRWSD